jgi:hypothetical protein
MPMPPNNAFARESADDRQLSACFLRDVAAAIEAVPIELGRKGPAGTEAELRDLFPSGFGLLRTWAMMLLGFAGLGFVAYRRTKKSAAVVNRGARDECT